MYELTQVARRVVEEAESRDGGEKEEGKGGEGEC